MIFCRVSEGGSQVQGHDNVDSEDQRNRAPPKSMWETVKTNLEKLDVLQILRKSSFKPQKNFQSTLDLPTRTNKRASSLNMNLERWKKR